jgi:hypothetical protein
MKMKVLPTQYEQNKFVGQAEGYQKTKNFMLIVNPWEKLQKSVSKKSYQTKSGE